MCLIGHSSFSARNSRKMPIYFSSNTIHGILDKPIYHPRGCIHAAADTERTRSRLSKRSPCPSVQMIHFFATAWP